MLQKFLHHLQQLIAQVHQKEINQQIHRSFKIQTREIPGILSVPSQNTDSKKPIHPQVGGGGEKSKVKTHMLLASVCYH